MISPSSLKEGWGGECSKRDTGLNKLNLGFIPGITWIFKNFWKSCLSAAALLSDRGYLPNSLQALEFTVKSEIKKAFICSRAVYFACKTNPNISPIKREKHESPNSREADCRSQKAF